jgi:hypothetical protein
LPKSTDSYWIISQDELQSYLNHHGYTDLFISKIKSVYQQAFPTYQSDIFSNKPWIFCMYIRGRFKKTNNRPRVYELPFLISSIVSILMMEIEGHGHVSIWNACNDLIAPKKGYMRFLFDAVIGYCQEWGITRITLYVALSNPYFSRAVQLYIEKGFYWVGMYRDMAVHMEWNPLHGETLDNIVTSVHSLGYQIGSHL